MSGTEDRTDQRSYDTGTDMGAPWQIRGNITSIASFDYVLCTSAVSKWMIVRDFDGGISSEQESTNCLVIHQDVKR